MTQQRIISYFERNPKLHVLFVFDKMNVISAELEDAKWEEPYKYHVFDGKWFNIKYNIEHTWKDYKVVLLFKNEGGHPLSFPQTEEQMLKFPLLDMLKANMEYKEDDYESFMQQYGLPDKFRIFIKKNITELMSSKISTMLMGMITPDAFSEDMACRAFISSYMNDKSLQTWESIIVRMICIDNGDAKKKADFYRKLEKNVSAKNAVDKKLINIFNVSYNPLTEYRMKDVVECLKYNSITQLLSPSPADMYKKYKITAPLKLDGINRIYEYGRQSRSWSEKFTAAVREIGKEIREEQIIEVYGTDSTYHYMTESLCWPIMKELLEERLMASPDEVNEKVKAISLKFPLTSDIQMVINFVEQVALFYAKLKTFSTLKLNSPNDYVDFYVNEFQYVDRFYRLALEAYHVLITKNIPIQHTVSNTKSQLDKEYAKITNVLNLEWLTCVKEKGSYFDSLTIPKQEDFYQNERSTIRQVIIISDALRYEVAAELLEKLLEKKHRAEIVPYRAMLPTETKYCKPSLLPHHSLKLQGTDMAVDGQVLTTTEQRTAHLAKYVEGAECITYDEVMNAESKSKREIFKKPLLYVFHNLIDESSHSQSPFETIRSCRATINNLVEFVNSLHASWNVSDVIITSDHGFIYNDMKFQDKDKHSITDSNIEKKTRYYITDNNLEVEGIEKFPLNKVSSIESTTPLFVAVPTGTNRLAASGGYNFAHGGATLHEMIIPVIRSKAERNEKREKVGVSLMNHNLNMVNSRLKFQIIQAEAVGASRIKRTVVCQIFDGDTPVTEEKVVNLDSTDAVNLNNRVYEVVLNLNQSVSSSMLQLRIYDDSDTNRLNPLLKETVKNNTMIEQDF